MSSITCGRDLPKALEQLGDGIQHSCRRAHHQRSGLWLLGNEPDVKDRPQKMSPRSFRSCGVVAPGK